MSKGGIHLQIWRMEQEILDVSLELERQEAKVIWHNTVPLNTYVPDRSGPISGK